MANEITLTFSLSFFKPAIMPVAISKALTGVQFTVTGTTYIEHSLLVPTSATAFPLGTLTSPHWALFINQDLTNYVQIMNGASGAVLLRLQPGEGFPCPLDPTAVPYGIAHTAACQVDYLIISA